jgi:hypothetical protein
MSTKARDFLNTFCLGGGNGMIPSEMNKLIQQAEQAKTYWLDHSLDQYDFILLLPHMDNQLNANMLSAFEAKLQRTADTNGGTCPEAVVLSVSLSQASKHLTFRQIPREVVESILVLYCMYEFTDKLIVGSFDLPYCRKLRNLLNCGIASEKELVDTVIGWK